MAGDRYAQSELTEETWEHRIVRVREETLDLIAATRKMINESRHALAAADASLERRD